MDSTRRVECGASPSIRRPASFFRNRIALGLKRYQPGSLPSVGNHIVNHETDIRPLRLPELNELEFKSDLDGYLVSQGIEDRDIGLKISFGAKNELTDISLMLGDVSPAKKNELLDQFRSSIRLIDDELKFTAASPAAAANVHDPFRADNFGDLIGHLKIVSHLFGNAQGYISKETLKLTIEGIEFYCRLETKPNEHVTINWAVDEAKHPRMISLIYGPDHIAFYRLVFYPTLMEYFKQKGELHPEDKKVLGQMGHRGQTILFNSDLALLPNSKYANHTLAEFYSQVSKSKKPPIKMLHPSGAVVDFYYWGGDIWALLSAKDIALTRETVGDIEQLASEANVQPGRIGVLYPLLESPLPLQSAL
jgi:hypothetical protein